MINVYEKSTRLHWLIVTIVTDFCVSWDAKAQIRVSMWLQYRSHMQNHRPLFNPLRAQSKEMDSAALGAINTACLAEANNFMSITKVS